MSPEAASVASDDASAAGLTFPVLIDHGGKIQLGLTFEMDDAAKNVLKGSGIDLEERNAGGNWMLPQTIVTGLNRRRSF